MKCKHNVPAELCPDCLRVEIERLKAAMIAAIKEDYQEADGPGAWKLAFFRVKGVLRRALEEGDDQRH